MKVENLWLFIMLFFVLGLRVFGQSATIIIVDPTAKAKSSSATAAEEKLVKNLLPKVRKIWDDEVCTEDFKITGVANGAFTRKNAAQKAFLYEFCQTGNSFANDGIVFTENGKVIGHFIYEGAWTVGLDALPDINRNGTSELMITNYGGMHQGISATGIDVIEFNGKSFAEIGATQIDYDASGADESGKGEVYSYKISVKTGAKPIFYREKFVRKSKAWRKIGSLAKAEMFKLNYKYQAVK